MEGRRKIRYPFPMHRIQRKGGKIYVEGVSLEALARRIAKEQDLSLNEVLRNAVEKGLGVPKGNGLESYAGVS